jgi:heterodisulfide reductase subunit A
MEMTKKSGAAVVIGAGISGIRAALDLAETGYQVYLVDKAPHIGGILEKLDWQFPTNRCGMCRMLPSVEPDQAVQQCLRRGLFHDRIEVLPATEVIAITGEAGAFQATLHQFPTLVDPNRCVGCGECEAVCPVEVKDDFNEGLSCRKAIYRPAPQVLPAAYGIDLAACTHCGECVSVCPTGAIHMAAAERAQFRILVVDDELIVRDSLRALLADEGFSVDMAESGEKALEALKAGAYDLMLLDIKMPGMEGVEVLKQALSAQPELQVVMMTAYATIETAVESMRTGAVDYLVKPFEEDALLTQVCRLYEESGNRRERVIEAGAVVIAAGCGYFDPADEKDVFGYGAYPDVVTHLEFERMMSGTGPCAGAILRPSDGRPVRRIAWIQCVGSRDLQADADFCSSICCMSAVKEAMIARERGGPETEAVIFYMDMRVFEKPFQQYLDTALAAGVRLQRCRVHSVTEADDGGRLRIRYVDESGAHETDFDLVVLSVGQRAAESARRFAEMLCLELNPWGYLAPQPFSLVETATPGVFLGGAVTGLTDINEAVIRSQAAACGASRAIHAKGGGLAPVEDRREEDRDIRREAPSVLVAACRCEGALSGSVDMDALSRRMKADPAVASFREVERLCTDAGRQELRDALGGGSFNRILVATCQPNAYQLRKREVAEAAGLPEKLVSVADVFNPEWFAQKEAGADLQAANADLLARRMKSAVAGLKQADPGMPEGVRILQQALVVGGGIAGMTAAMAIADHGFHVDLLEKGEVLGGNLNWLVHTLQGGDVSQLLEETTARVNAHALIDVHLNSEAIESRGGPGRFETTIRSAELTTTLSHGVTVLATGGVEAAPQSYGYGKSPAVRTHQEFETACSRAEIDPEALSAVAMIQCADCREGERNYCSRICCQSAIKHALFLKEKNPEIAVYVLYRDMMTTGFSEAYFTKARKEGVVFFPYTQEAKPEVTVPEEKEGEGAFVRIRTWDPVLGQPVEIEADLLLLASGVSPVLPGALMESLELPVDEHGFFKEADFKWRPVESLTPGVYACGLALSPRSIEETVASAEAAAMRAVRMISRPRLSAGRRIAVVRRSLCSACRLCMTVCPYGAREVEPETGDIVVRTLKCQGCGACAAVCPNSATVLSEGSEREMFEVIDAALGYS